MNPRLLNRVSTAALILTCVVGSKLWANEPLALDQVLNRVLEANLRLQVQKLDQQMAEERAQAEYAIFEPVLLLTLAREGNSRENSAEQFLSQRVSEFDENNTIYSAAVESQLSSGARVRLGSQTRGLENNLQSGDAKEWETFTGVTVTQPFLKGKGWSVLSSQIKLAAADSAVALQDYRGQLALVLSEAEMAYWELAAATEFVDLSENSVEVARIMLNDNRERFEAGKLTELEVLQAESGVALREANLSAADQRRLDAAARLDAFLGRRSSVSGNIKPIESLKSQDASLYLDTGMEEGFKKHPAYIAQTERCRQAGIRLAYARNEKLPALDLKASYGLNGLSDTLSTSLNRTVTDSEHPSWYVGFEMRYPIFGGKREKHQLAAAKMRTRQALLELSAIEIELVNGMIVLEQRVESLQSRLQAMLRVVDLNERVLANEQDYLREGKSESRKVLEAEEDLSESHLDSLAAALELRKAFVDTMVQKGTYLDKRGFELDFAFEPFDEKALH
ncbi:MAG: TolC family protein [Verrucomicrobiota bacterium]